MPEWTDDVTSNDLKTLFDANTILKADTDNTPEALTVAEQRLVGRITSGVITALTAAQVKTLLAIDHGADVSGLSDDDHPHYLLRSFMNGSFKEKFNATVASSGGTITMSIEQAGGGDLIMQFSDAITTLDCTPADTIELTAGDDDDPQANWIYIPQSSKVLTKSTSAWPAGEHIKVGFFFCQSAASMETAGGPIINQNFNDFLEDPNSQGHLLHITDKLRLLDATYFSGIDGVGTTGYLTITAGNVEFKSAAGVIYQLHKHTFPAFDTTGSGDTMHVKNWSGDAYHAITNLHDIVADSGGNSIGTNKWFNMVMWGVQNKDGEHQTVLINLPSGFYNTQSDAENDVSGHDDFTMPREFTIDSGVGFLIARITVKKAGTWIYGSAVDLRGTNPQTASGGASGIATSFADSAFDIFDETDNTKVFAFDVGTNVSTGNTRTLKVPDFDGTIATLAGTEELDNKTLDSSVAKGTWTVSGTWTIPAVTLGGAVAGGDQAFTGVGDITFTNGSILAAIDGAGTTLLLKAGGLSGTTFITLTSQSGGTDTMTLATFGMGGAAITGHAQAISDNVILTVDGSPNSGEYGRFTAAGLEGRTEAEFKADFNLEIGTDVLAEQTIGIADNNLLEVDHASPADNDFAKFTASGLEGRSYAETLSDLSGEATAEFLFNTQKIGGVVDPTTDQQAATKKYVDDNSGGDPGEGHITIIPLNYDSVGQGTWVTNLDVANLLSMRVRNSSANDADNISYKVSLGAGTYSLRMIYEKNSDAPIVDFDIDATEVGSVDTYGSGNNHEDTTTGIVIADSGLKTLKVRADGKNGSSSGYELRIILLSLWRTA